MSTAVGTGAVRQLNAVTVAQYLASESGLASGKRKAVLLRAAPVWDGPPELSFGERRAGVAAAVSPLAVYELVLAHFAPDANGPEVLAILTDREESDLGADLLARVHKQRVNAVDVWHVVREVFGARDTDPRLPAENWAAESLLDATPPGGWPRLPGGMLTRGYALTLLALRRLGAGPYDPDREDPAPGGVAGGAELDVNTLLRWSLSPGGPDRFLALRAQERAGLTRFLGEEDRTGLAGRALLALAEAGHGPDAVAFGLVCAALWIHAEGDANAEDYRARGRAERWFGDEPPAPGEALDALVRAFGRASEEFVTALLAAGHPAGNGSGGRAGGFGGSGSAARNGGAVEARRLWATVLDRAASLTRQFGAGRAAGTSPVLRAGLDAAFAALGRALADGAPERTAAAIEVLEQHAMADERDARVRIERARMAQRLARWLATEPPLEAASPEKGIARHITETGWVDLALEHIEAGGDPTTELAAAYSALCTAVRARRREIDRHFAQRLAAWTTAGTAAGVMLTVESFLTRVVGPVVKGGRHRLLLIVLDGMSAAIAAELGEELRRDWAEYDPLPDTESPPCRRGMAAALPTVTAVSRTSLFAGKLMTGSQRDERVLFARHPFWGGQGVALFHKDDLRAGNGGEVFGSELYEALTADHKHVAVVLNTVDDRLAKEQKLGDGSWQLSDIGGLPELLRMAAAQGRAVILTSDHGHVVDRHGQRVQAGTPLSARHRAPGGPLAGPEIELAGPRVVSPDAGGSIVALWDADSRYTARKAGYHGGASLAEVTIPVLAFLPFGAEPPRGWRELGGQQPTWWSSEAVPPVGEAVRTSAARQPKPGRGRKTRQQDTGRTTGGEPALFDVQVVPDGENALFRAEAVSPDDALVRALLDSELFRAQQESLARRPDQSEVEEALRELLKAGGTLPVTALAQRIGVPARRAGGFSAVLRQLLNFDGVQVLESLPDGRTLRLNRSLLKEQFELT